MKFVNLTPHSVNILSDEGATVAVFEPSGTLARCQESRVSYPPLVGGIGVTRATYGAVTGLPEPDGATAYIVSALVLAQCAGRADVFAPGPAARDDNGRIVGCYGLSAAPMAT
jgi:hypothetical protein